jgi:hypothetical protein
MKRQVTKTLSAFLIAIIIMSITPPVHVEASYGTVVISGQVTYQPRNWNPQSPNWQVGREMQIDLYHMDLQGNDHYLATTVTDENGNFSFPSRLNWWSLDNRRLNVYFEIITAYPSSMNPITSVTDRLSAQYAFASDTTYLYYDGNWTKNFSITGVWPSYQAIWIFEDLRNAWNYVHENDFRNGVPYDPGNVKAVWEFNLDCYPIEIGDFDFNCGSFVYGVLLPHFIFIANGDNNSMETVVHETGHIFMVNANGWWYVDSNCFEHYIDESSDVECAWAEGWAEFFPLVVNGDPCYDFLEDPCEGLPDEDYYNLEVHNRTDDPDVFHWGDSVEGRVAASMYDLYDTNNEGFDWRSAGYGPISKIALGSSQVTTFQNFWNGWIGSSQDPVLSGFTLWWNTINYANIQQIYLPIIRR